jgi:hypothetical protein
VSIWYSHDFACPSCNEPMSALLARGIHAKRAPAVRAQILSSTLHRIQCPACETEIDAHREVAYTDFERHHWVHVARPDELPRWAAVERDALACFDRVMTQGAPVVAPLAAAFRVRVVFDLDELRERLAIWDAGLDDGIVECVKLACVRDDPAVLAAGHRIRVREIAPGGGLVLAAIAPAAPRDDAARWTVPAGTVAAITADAADWRRRMPELFARGFVAFDRYLITAA